MSKYKIFNAEKQEKTIIQETWRSLIVTTNERLLFSVQNEVLDFIKFIKNADLMFHSPIQHNIYHSD